MVNGERRWPGADAQPDPRPATGPEVEAKAALEAALEAPLGITPALPRAAYCRLRMLPDGGGAELHAAPARCPRADPIGRGRAIVGGATLRNLELAIAGLGRQPVVRPLPDPGDPLHLATVTLGEARAPDEADLIQYRELVGDHGPRAVLDDRPVEASVARWLRHVAADHGGVHALPVEGDRLRTVGTVLAAALSQRRCGEDELCDVDQWLGDGDRGSPRSERAAIIGALERGVLMLVTTDADGPPDWLSAGRALQSAWLTATSLGLAASAVGGVLDAPGVRAALTMRLRLAECPQLLLRAGWPAPA